MSCEKRFAINIPFSVHGEPGFFLGTVHLVTLQEQHTLNYLLNYHSWITGNADTILSS